MATIQLSALISNIKGSINGSTFQRSAAGLTLRNKPVNVGRGTNSQQNVKNITARLNFEWSNLTDEQRIVWAMFSNFNNGQAKTYKNNSSANTGKMQFITVNFWILQYNKPILINPSFVAPELAFIPCPPFFNVSNSLLNYTGSLDTTQQILVTKVSMAQSLSTNTANTGFRTLIYSQVDGDTQDWFGAYLNTFGVLPEPNKRFWVSLQVVNFITGAISKEAKQLVLYIPSFGSGIGSMVVGSTNIVG
jgi:hypothetical protein